MRRNPGRRLTLRTRRGCVMQPPTITYLSDIWFGSGAIRELPEILARFNIRRALLVTDRGVVAGGIIERVELQDSVLFDAIESNPDESSVDAGVERYRAEKCDG